MNRDRIKELLDIPKPLHLLTILPWLSGQARCAAAAHQKTPLERCHWGRLTALIPMPLSLALTQWPRGSARGGSQREPKVASGCRVVLSMLMMLVSVPAVEGTAEIYTWVDRDGQVHFTDDYSIVPPEYRDRVESRPSSRPSALPPPPAPSGTSRRRRHRPCHLIHRPGDW